MEKIIFALGLRSGFGVVVGSGTRRVRTDFGRPKLQSGAGRILLEQNSRIGSDHEILVDQNCSEALLANAFINLLNLCMQSSIYRFSRKRMSRKTDIFVDQEPKFSVIQDNGLKGGFAALALGGLSFAVGSIASGLATAIMPGLFAATLFIGTAIASTIVIVARWPRRNFRIYDTANLVNSIMTIEDRTSNVPNAARNFALIATGTPAVLVSDLITTGVDAARWELRYQDGAAIIRVTADRKSESLRSATLMTDSYNPGIEKFLSFDFLSASTGERLANFSWQLGWSDQHELSIAPTEIDQRYFLALAIVIASVRQP